MDDVSNNKATDCIEDLRLSVSPSEFGYKVQALAAHVLLRLEFQVEQVNRSGHPDIVATSGMETMYFEIEAQVGRPRRRKLTKEDFRSLTEVPGSVGYFALAIRFPTPRWVVVPADRLKRRDACSNVLLEALSDPEFSKAWTSAYIELLRQQCGRIRRASFATLRGRALAGRGL